MTDMLYSLLPGGSSDSMLTSPSGRFLDIDARNDRKRKVKIYLLKWECPKCSDLKM